MANVNALRKAEKIKDVSKYLVEDLKEPLYPEKVTDETIEEMELLAKLNRVCLPGQVAPVGALTKGLIVNKGGILLAEMGTGKTQMSFAIWYLLNNKLKNKKGTTSKALFLTVGKLMEKMTQEAYAVIGKDSVKVFEIISIYPHDKNTDGSPKRFSKDTKRRDRYNVMTKYKKGELVPSKLKPNQVFPEEVIDMKVPKGMTYIYMLSKDSGKIGFQSEFVMEWGDRCTECNNFILPKNFIQKYKADESQKFKLNEISFRGKPLNCPHCGDSCEVYVSKNLHTAKNPIFPHMVDKRMDKKGSRRIPVGKRFRNQLDKRKEKKVFDLIIVDEVHEMQSPDSIQGRLYRDLVNITERALIMTGTLSNGYPSSIFYILQGILPNYLKKEGFKFYDVNKFVDIYGSLKYTKTADIIEKKGNSTKVKVNEMPKISEGIISLLAPFTYWLKMEDLNLPMPSYREDPYTVEMDDEVKETLDNFKTAVIQAISKHDPKRMKSFAQRFVYLQNNPTFPFHYEFEANVIQFNEITGEDEVLKKLFSFDFKPVPEDKVYSKEARLISYIKSELIQGRNVMVYSIYNKAAKISERLGKVISEGIEDIVIKVMPESVGGDKILPWIQKNPCDVMICSPLKVSTGLDLVQFPTIAFYETGTNLRTVQQASRRSWRAFGQDFNVKVAFFAYQGIQARLLDLLGKKLKGAAIVEGRAVESGQLASVFDDDADFTEALINIAKEIEEDVQPDFSSSIIEEGKVRPNTVYEQAYIDILDRNNKDNDISIVDEFIHNHEDSEVISDEALDMVNLSEDNPEDALEFEPIDIHEVDIDISNLEIDKVEVDISNIEVDNSQIDKDKKSVACKCKSGQLTFDF